MTVVLSKNITANTRITFWTQTKKEMKWNENKQIAVM